jgi:hypothetical protein
MRSSDDLIIMEDGSVFADLTDWERLENMTDEEIEEAALGDPDNPPMTEEKWTFARRLRDLPGDTLVEKMQALKTLTPAAEEQSASVRRASEDEERLSRYIG